MIDVLLYCLMTLVSYSFVALVAAFGMFMVDMAKYEKAPHLFDKHVPKYERESFSVYGFLGFLWLPIVIMGPIWYIQMKNDEKKENQKWLNHKSF